MNWHTLGSMKASLKELKKNSADVVIMYEGKVLDIKCISEVPSGKVVILLVDRANKNK